MLSEPPFTDADLNELRAAYAKQRAESLSGVESPTALIMAFADEHGSSYLEVLIALIEQDRREHSS